MIRFSIAVLVGLVLCCAPRGSTPRKPRMRTRKQPTKKPRRRARSGDRPAYRDMSARCAEEKSSAGRKGVIGRFRQGRNLSIEGGVSRNDHGN